MNKITAAFQNGKAFIPFLTGGDPDIETTEKLIRAMAEAGADYKAILTHYYTGVTVAVYGG